MADGSPPLDPSVSRSGTPDSPGRRGFDTPYGSHLTHKKIIDSFTLVSGYGFLSNFYSSTVTLDGKKYPSVEHAYQAAKTSNEETRELIRKARSPGEAKKLGRALQLKSDWNSSKIELMRGLVREKFESPFLAYALLGTGDVELVNGNTWNDRFWGVCRGTGQNWLGKILMEVREDLRRNPDYAKEERNETGSGHETGPEDESS